MIMYRDWLSELSGDEMMITDMFGFYFFLKKWRVSSTIYYFTHVCKKSLVLKKKKILICRTEKEDEINKHNKLYVFRKSQFFYLNWQDSIEDFMMALFCGV